MIIGTAGHIDHGKSTLTTALTGKPMDRLAEERRRGITIELGFAPLDLGGPEPAGIVDVPGHEDFVRTMVAGASGVDLLLLVVDAQEGIRPQTLEHLAVAEQLRVPAGIPVITKADLADPDWLELVRADLVERLARSSIRFEAPAVVSAVTGQGIADLQGRLRDLSRSRTRRIGEGDLLRLPIDRVFALPGAGTVVTGTVWSGTARVGDTVRVEPGGRVVRVRSVESFGHAVPAAVPGARIALGLHGVAHHDVRRGQVVVGSTPAWAPAEVFDGVLNLLPDAPRPLTTRTRVRVHHGTAEVMARVHPRQPVGPGAAGPARVVLESPLMLRGGDRLVLRSYSPVTTIGGGWVADPAPPRRGARWDADLLSEDGRSRVRGLAARRADGIPVDQLPMLTGLTPNAAADAARSEGGLIELGGRLVPAAGVESASEALVERLRQFHKTQPSQPGMSLETLRNSLGRRSWMAEGVLERLAAGGVIAVREGVVGLADFVPEFAGGEGEVERVVEALRAAGLEPPSVAELAESLTLKDLKSALRIASGRGLVQAVERDRYYAAEVLARFAEVVRAVGQGGAEIQPAVLRDRTGLSRKYLIPLLEWSDRVGLTYRDPQGARRLVRS